MALSKRWTHGLDGLWKVPSKGTALHENTEGEKAELCRTQMGALETSPGCWKGVAPHNNVLLLLLQWGWPWLNISLAFSWGNAN